MASGAEITLFFKGPQYKSAKPGYAWLKDGAQGSGSYKCFIAADKFSGARLGYVFKAGKSGLGYYLDQPLEAGKAYPVGGSAGGNSATYSNRDDSILFVDVPEVEEGTDDDEGSDGPVGDDDEQDGLDTIQTESVCMNCEENGMTRLMRVTVPFFGEMMLSSFRCDECGYRDTTTEPISDIMPKGVSLELEVDSLASLNRKVVTTKWTSIKFPSLELEIPPGTSAGGRLTTIEGLVQEATVKLHESNKYRKSQLDKLNEEEERLKLEGKELGAALKEEGAKEQNIADVITAIVVKLAAYARGMSLPFTVTLDDPAGQAMVENPSAPGKDPYCKITAYTRTPEQDRIVGVQYQTDSAAVHDDEEGEEPATKEGTAKKNKLTGEEISTMFYSAANNDTRFASPCGQCGKMGENRMAITKIPNFSEIILMCFVCENCGFKDAEVKPGGSIGDKGTVTTLRCTAETAMEDLKRDVLKSGDASIEVPELGFESGFGTLGAVYTTVEGLLTQTRENMSGNTFSYGDSSTTTQRTKMEEFIAKMDAIIAGHAPFTLIIHDPIAASWIYSPLAPAADPQIEIVHYERTHDENEMLGLNQIDTAECDAAEEAERAADAAAASSPGIDTDSAASNATTAT